MSKCIQVGELNTLFKSDKFMFLHPSGVINDSYDDVFSNEALDNMKHFHQSATLDKQIDDETDSEYLGGFMVFPEAPDDLKQYAYDRVSYIVPKILKKLKRQYSEPTDPVGYYKISDTGNIFSGSFINIPSNEKYTERSIAIYIPGVSIYTLSYITETIYDRFISNGKSRRENKTRFKSCLVYDLNNKKFYQYSEDDDIIYCRKSKAIRDCGLSTYSCDITSIDDSFD